MTERDHSLTIEDLAERAEVPIRTIRYYISEGLLPGPGTRGKAAAYSDEHLGRLRLIRLLAEQRVPLAQMRPLLDRLSPAEVEALLEEENQRAAELRRAAQGASPKAYVSGLLEQARAARATPAAAEPARPTAPLPKATAARAALGAPATEHSGETWQRIVLAPGVELHVRHDAAGRYRALVERLLRTAREDGGS